MNKLEAGWYLKMETGPEWATGCIYVGPYPTKERADEDSDRFVNTRTGESLLESFMVESIKTVKDDEVDARHLTNFASLFKRPDALA